MGFITQFNPFKKDRQNFPGVVIPLSSAPAYSSQDSNSEKKKEQDEGATLDRSSSAEHGSAGSIPDTSYLTIEILRREVDEDIGAGSNNTIYDRTYQSNRQPKATYAGPFELPPPPPGAF